MNNEKRCCARESLITAAKKLFAEKAYKDVGTRELADAAGVNLAAIQYHFGSKAKLFAAAINTMMKEAGCDRTALDDGSPIEGKEDAAIRLCKFIYELLDYTLRNNGVEPCRMMSREVFGSTASDPELLEALVSSVVEDFMKPLDVSMIKVLGVLMPGADKNELEYAMNSIIGQCSLYQTHGPFMDRLREKKYWQSPYMEEAARWVCRFTLRGLGCDANFIQRVIIKVLG